jgi:enamine deaminase RidA (YjgF/YER057c/UK114 family)
MKKISLINPSNLPKVDYAYASKIPSDMKLIFLAGSCPLNNDGIVPKDSDYVSQANLCISNLKKALKESGASINDVVYTRVLVASSNRADLVNTWNTINKEFKSHNVPSTLFGVTVLGYENQLVEIEAFAAIE